jgi:CheY-like chemotaxis protein
MRPDATPPASATEYVLVIEDDDDLREAIADVLQDEGHVVRTARNGREALDYLRAHPAPCMILLDLMMPVMTGDQFRAAQLADPALAAVPVVVMTASNDGRQRAEKMHALEYLAKPVMVPRLLDTIQRHC